MWANWTFLAFYCCLFSAFFGPKMLIIENIVYFSHFMSQKCLAVVDYQVVPNLIKMEYRQCDLYLYQ